eukprot:9201421-Lingulodinium_polyedra.AAC.1
MSRVTLPPEALAVASWPFALRARGRKTCRNPCIAAPAPCAACLLRNGRIAKLPNRAHRLA